MLVHSTIVWMDYGSSGGEWIESHLVVDQEAVEAELLAGIWVGGHPNPGDAHPNSDPPVVSEG